jgi:hypothetical protein
MWAMHLLISAMSSISSSFTDSTTTRSGKCLTLKKWELFANNLDLWTDVRENLREKLVNLSFLAIDNHESKGEKVQTNLFFLKRIRLNLIIGVKLKKGNFT